MKKYFKYITVLLLLISVSVNFYLGFRIAPKEEAVVHQEKALPKKRSVSEEKNETSDTYVFPINKIEELKLHNPIDEFFENEVYPKTGGGTPMINYNSSLYYGVWYVEMDNAYSVLLNRAHEDLVEYIISSQEHFKAFCSAEAVPRLLEPILWLNYISRELSNCFTI